MKDSKTDMQRNDEQICYEGESSENLKYFLSRNLLNT